MKLIILDFNSGVKAKSNISHIYFYPEANGLSRLINYTHFILMEINETTYQAS